jgi:hypothetical protein
MNKFEAREPQRWGKDHLAYWRGRISKQKGSPYYYVHFQYRRQRHKLSLETPNPEAAAARARTLYEQVRANGWEAYLADRAEIPKTHEIRVSYERCHKRLVLLQEELTQRPNGNRLSKRFW